MVRHPFQRFQIHHLPLRSLIHNIVELRYIPADNEAAGAGRNLLGEDSESEFAHPGPESELSVGLTARF
jgi:hypothetical protein